MEQLHKDEMKRLADKYAELAAQKSILLNRLWLTTCPAQKEIGEFVIAAFNAELRNIRADWQVYEDMRLAEYKKSEVHNFLMGSKGMSGFNILLNLKQTA